VYLKSLTLKGFKSFASPTTLRFEPGITCVLAVLVGLGSLLFYFASPPPRPVRAASL